MFLCFDSVITNNHWLLKSFPWLWGEGAALLGTISLSFRNTSAICIWMHWHLSLVNTVPLWLHRTCSLTNQMIILANRLWLTISLWKPLACESLPKGFAGHSPWFLDLWPYATSTWSQPPKQALNFPHWVFADISFLIGSCDPRRFQASEEGSVCLFFLMCNQALCYLCPDRALCRDWRWEQPLPNVLGNILFAIKSSLLKIDIIVKHKTACK